ncbi:hypothetical protein CK203_113086 [Vitis vinifera]|uniref:Tf2-1-like SH3-like domain-containing protein n=1 Tax=Vitis vinifera TaxID=29760 RepID=A0A438FE50_VITVI|nr:hypothetical protein CK203_113086 [Vitis vinifera]
MKSFADAHCHAVQFKVGDFVYLKLHPYRLRSLARRNEKFSTRYFSPYKVLQQIGPIAYKLELPSSATIHPVFHDSYLKQALGSTDLCVRQSPNINPLVIEVLIEWKGLPQFEASWKSANTIKEHFPDFHLEDKVSQIREGGGRVGSNDRPPIHYVYSKQGKRSVLPSSRGGKLLETPGAIYTKPLVEECGKVLECLEMSTHLYTMVEGMGGVQGFLESSRNLLYILVHRVVHRIRARLRGGHSKGSMSGSNVEETSEQTRGREMEHTTRGRGRKDKSRDALANMEARLAKVELAMADTREGVDLIEQGMEKGLEDLREQIQDLQSRDQEVRQELAIYKAVVSARVMATQEASRVEVPKPQGLVAIGMPRSWITSYGIWSDTLRLSH